MRRLRDHNCNSPEYYEKIWAEEYHNNNNHRYDHARLLDLLKYVKPGDRVIDLGAGLFGACQYAVHHLKDHYPNTTFVALDYSHTAKEIAQRDFPDLTYLLGDVTNTGLPGDHFDVVISGEVIEHLEEPLALVKEMARICQPGGHMMLSTLDPETEDAKKHGEYPEHVWEFEVMDLVDMFKSYGLTEYWKTGNYHMISCQNGVTHEKD